MGDKDNSILAEQALWFKINVGLFVIIGSMFMYDYIGEKQINKDQSKLLALNTKDIAVSKAERKSEAIEYDRRFKVLEHVVFTK